MPSLFAAPSWRIVVFLSLNNHAYMRRRQISALTRLRWRWLSARSHIPALIVSCMDPVYDAQRNQLKWTRLLAGSMINFIFSYPKESHPPESRQIGLTNQALWEIIFTQSRFRYSFYSSTAYLRFKYIHACMHTYMRLYIGVRRLVRHSVAGQLGRYVCPAADSRRKGQNLARERGLLTTFFHASVQGICS